MHPEEVRQRAKQEIIPGAKAGRAWVFIDLDLVDRITEIRVGEDVSNATVNRVLEIFGAALRRAVDDWEWLDKCPHVRKAITQVSTKAWYSALERAGIEEFRWHDLRHTWASWHVQGGTPLFALQELGGWESSDMVRRYAYMSADHLAPYADRLAPLRGPDAKIDGTNPSQPPKQKGPTRR